MGDKQQRRRNIRTALLLLGLALLFYAGIFIAQALRSSG